MNSRTNSDLQDQLAQMSKELSKLKFAELLYHDEISALKAETRSYREEIESLNRRNQDLERQAVQDTPARTIGTEVRLRYLERHRRNMGKFTGKEGYDRIKRGDRAAHRGRPIVDSWLCLTGQINDHNVYKDLYGVSPKCMMQWIDIPEIVEATGFRASLQSEGRLKGDFPGLFERFLELVSGYPSPDEIRKAFETDKSLQQYHQRLQYCYDSIVAANPR
ncbi:hypothetical protein M422DRAFT_30778 [Sphaerobolus stellatus SS14]|uniref:Uncharacterized protein n=1 Tax=Sphaerobolus stellatus (strain SS14) TaxID=990650 RepID=A0A0C9VXU2_SPHS4|nr:hypothetical protein M422DRAFT_30778 [Sphaerobolus stellatus SS14]